jgi:hypothetical protein
VSKDIRRRNNANSLSQWQSHKFVAAYGAFLKRQGKVRALSCVQRLFRVSFAVRLTEYLRSCLSPVGPTPSRPASRRSSRRSTQIGTISAPPPLPDMST